MSAPFDHCSTSLISIKLEDLQGSLCGQAVLFATKHRVVTSMTELQAEEQGDSNRGSVK